MKNTQIQIKKMRSAKKQLDLKERNEKQGQQGVASEKADVKMALNLGPGCLPIR